MRPSDVIVAGAGIVGSAFALGLRGAGLTVTVVEPRPPEVGSSGSWDNRVYTVSPGNAAWLESLGVSHQLPPERLSPVQTMVIYGDEPPGRLEFSAYDAGLRELAVVLEARELQLALWRALEEADHVSIIPRTRPCRIVWERDRARVGMEDGSELDARLVVAADGADSWVREQAGIDSIAQTYDQLGVVANFETERPHHATAYQWFAREGILALLPLPGNRVSMVWSVSAEFGANLLTSGDDALCRAVEQESAEVLGRLRLITPAAGFELKRQRVHRLVEPRVALVGDAAHNLHPLAGQGVNLGMRDARELARVLSARGGQPDCGDYALLRRYERARKEDILALELTTHGLQKLFSNGAVWMARLRNAGLGLLDLQPPLKNILIRRATA